MKEQRPLKGSRPPRMERVYVKVNSDFDATGYIQPRSITWADGRTFMIEAVKDFRPASCYRKGAEGVCYTVTIRGEEKRLLHRMDGLHLCQPRGQMVCGDRGIGCRISFMEDLTPMRDQSAH